MSTNTVTEVPVMKLSEAIRVGSALSRPGTRRYFDTDLNGNVIACALGAAAIGVAGVEASRGKVNLILRGFLGVSILQPGRLCLPTEVLESRFASEYTSINDVVVYLNDTAYWSREAIADWLETQGF